MSALCQSRPFAPQQNDPIYSITSSARASSVGGTVKPSAFAVLRLMTSSYLVGACTGRWAASHLCPDSDLQLKDIEDSERTLGQRVHILRAASQNEVDTAFKTLTQLKP